MPQNQQLEGRAAVITGASAGIGRAIARNLASMGARVVLNARRQGILDSLADEINAQYGSDRACVVAGDAADERVIDMMLDAPKKNFDLDADLIVVNAGRGLNGSVMTSNTEEWDEMIRTNLHGAAMLIRKGGLKLVELQASRDWPSSPADLVVLGSTVGRHISPFSSMYGSTKFAVNSLAEAARREIGPRGVRVTLVEPGIVESEFQSVAGYDPEGFGALMDKFGPVLQPDDIARPIGFVCSQPPSVHICDLVIRPTRQDYP